MKSFETNVVLVWDGEKSSREVLSLVEKIVDLLEPLGVEVYSDCLITELNR
jgi:hypothetical protein